MCRREQFSNGTVEWDISSDDQPGTYRLVHFGHAKLESDVVVSYTGIDIHTYKFKLQNIFRQDKKIIREWGYFFIFFFMFSSRFMLFPTFLETYKTHKGYRTHELTTYVCNRQFKLDDVYQGGQWVLMMNGQS